MKNCIFCKITNGEIPAHKVYETENVTAFLDTNPTSKGHTLLIPKKHVKNIHNASEMEYMWNALVKVSNAVKKAFNAEGINITQNNGKIAGQEVFHLHFHITPRYTGDEIEINYNKNKLTNGEHIASKIQEQLS